MINYEKISQIIYEKIKDELEQKPKTKEEIHNPMQKKTKEELYNAIFCYDENDNICGYNIQVRLEQDEIYKFRFYLPIVDDNWKNARHPKDLPDKKVKIGFDGNFQSQNELLEKNDIKLALAMYLNLKSPAIVCSGDGFVGLSSSEVLYLVVKGFKYAGYPINDATKKMNETKLFVW